MKDRTVILFGGAAAWSACRGPAAGQWPPWWWSSLVIAIGIGIRGDRDQRLGQRHRRPTAIRTFRSRRGSLTCSAG